MGSSRSRWELDRRSNTPRHAPRFVPRWVSDVLDTAVERLNIFSRARIVLELPKHLAQGTDGGWVTVARSKGRHPIGMWYRVGELYFADLRSPEQEYGRITFSEVGLNRVGGYATRAALRDAVAAIWLQNEKA